MVRHFTRFANAMVLTGVIAILLTGDALGQSLNPPSERSAAGQSAPNRINNSVPAPNGRPSVLLFVRGSFCPHCVSQTTQMATALSGHGYQVSVISGSSADDLQRFPTLPFTLIADPGLKLFKQFGALDESATGDERIRHATIVRDGKGAEIFKIVGAQPLMNPVPVLLALNESPSPTATVVAGSAPATNTSGPCQCQTTAALPRVRKNVDCLTDQELRNLEHAFKVLQDRSATNPNDPTGYDYQVQIHRQRCQHNSELIWPWHRAFLYYFEDLLRASDPDNPETPTKDVTLAYWDWTKPPSAVSYPTAFENPVSPLFHAGRTVWGPLHPFRLFTAEDTGLDIGDWSSFGGSTTGPGQLEAGTVTGDAPHNRGHADVGGDMPFPARSVRDPIFWAHHANLDRLWDLWQQRWRVNPQQQSAPLLGWPGTPTPSPVVSNFNDIRGQLKYDYCNPPEPLTIDLPLPIVTQPTGSPPVSPLSVTIDLKDLRRQHPPARLTRAIVRLSGVNPRVSSIYSARVFIHPASVPFKSGDLEFVNKYLAGGFTLLPLEAEHDGSTTVGEHPEKLDLDVDVTKRFEDLRRQGSAANGLTISFDFKTGTGRELVPAAYGEKGISFGSARLIVYPSGS